MSDRRDVVSRSVGFLMLIALCGGCSTDGDTPASARTQGAEKGGVWFDGGLDQALAQAKAKQRLVFVDVWASWCGPCKKLQRETFPDADVQRAMQQFVCLSVDGESKSGLQIAEHYNVHGYPTMLFLDSAGTERARIEGFQSPEPFTRQLEEIRQRSGAR